MMNIDELSLEELEKLEIEIKLRKRRKKTYLFEYDVHKKLEKLIDCNKFPSSRTYDASKAIAVLASFATTNYVEKGSTLIQSATCLYQVEYEKVCDELFEIVKNHFDRNKLYNYFDNLNDEQTKNVTQTDVKRNNNIFVSEDMVNLMLIDTGLTEEEIMEKLGYAGEKLSNRYITKEIYDKIESILKKS